MPVDMDDMDRPESVEVDSEMYKKIMDRIRPIYKSGLFVLNMIDSSILNLEHNIDEYNSKLAQKTRVGVGTNSSKIYQV